MQHPQHPADDEYTLTELARASEMTERNVRSYQARGLLPPPRRRSRRVVYGPEHVARLRLVQALAGHGLTLRVIADLVERGTADDELARLAREELSTAWVPAGSVSMQADRVRRFDEDHPGVVEKLVGAGLMERHGDELRANATALGLTSSVVARGGSFDECARIGLSGAEAARACGDAIADLVDQCLSRHHGALQRSADGPPDDPASQEQAEDELRRLVVQLASVAFADSLTRRVVGKGVSAPGAAADA